MGPLYCFLRTGEYVPSSEIRGPTSWAQLVGPWARGTGEYVPSSEIRGPTSWAQVVGLWARGPVGPWLVGPLYCSLNSSAEWVLYIASKERVSAHAAPKSVARPRGPSSWVRGPVGPWHG